MTTKKHFSPKMLAKLEGNETFLYLEEWISQNGQQFVNNSITNLAEMMHVSQSTITRFSKALNFRSFKDLQFHVLKNLERYKVDDNILESQHLNFEQIKSNIYTYYTYAIKKNFANIKEDDILSLVNSIKKATTNIIFGIGASGYIAKHFAFLLNTLNIHGIAITSIHDFFPFIKLVQKENAHLIIISKSFSTKEVLYLYELFKDDSSEKVSIIKSSHEDDQKLLCKNLLTFDSIDQPGKRIFSPISSKIAQFMLLDIIFTYIISQDKKNIAQDLMISSKLFRDEWNK